MRVWNSAQVEHKIQSATFADEGLTLHLQKVGEPGLQDSVQEFKRDQEIKSMSTTELIKQGLLGSRVCAMSSSILHKPQNTAMWVINNSNASGELSPALTSVLICQHLPGLVQIISATLYPVQLGHACS